MQKVSVITINRNNAHGLEKTIKSVLSQTYENYEYIVIDGCSTDTSVDIIKNYSSGITYWISEPDNGVYNAMNKGIGKAQGEYIIFMNSGDIFVSENVLENVFHQERNADFLVGISMVIGKKIVYKRKLPKEATFYDMFKTAFSHQSTFTRRQIFEEFGEYDESLFISSDWKLMLVAVNLHHKKIELIQEKIAVTEPGGISGSDTSGQLLKQEREKILKENFPTFYKDYVQMHRFKRFSLANIKEHIIWRLRHFLIS